MSSSSSGGGQDPSLTTDSEGEGNDELGPFITVVSVDGGLQCGNKLTVITPTEICEMSKQGKQAIIRKLDTSHDKPSSSRVTSKLTRPNGDFVKAGPSSSSTNNGDASSISSKPRQRSKESQEATSTDTSQGGAAYVTVLALTEQALHDAGKNKPKSAIPVRAEPSPLSGKKSVVNICNSNPSPGSGTAKGPSTTAASNSENGVKGATANGNGEGDQVVTIGNKALITKEKEIPYMHQVKNASIVEITMKECNNDNASRRNNGGGSGDENGVAASSWGNDIPPKVREPVVVYRLPGERLGFALKFDGGTGSATERVKHLVVQSCAEGSPAKRTTTSWGNLGEGDEIIEIETIPVQSMTRMDCVQSLKDSSVAVKLLIEHTYTLDEIQLLREHKRENNADHVSGGGNNVMKNAAERKHPAAGSGIPTIHKQTKENKSRETTQPQKELYQNQKSVHSGETSISEKGVISNNPNQRVTTTNHDNAAEQRKSRKLSEIPANSPNYAVGSARNDISENEFDDEASEAGRGNNSRIPIKRGHTSSSKLSQGHYNNAGQSQSHSESPEYANNNFAHTKAGEKLDELKLQPPVGFEDEQFHSQQQQRFSVGHYNYCEGKNKSEKNQSLANDHYYKANEVEKLNESEEMALLAENHSHTFQPESMTINNNAVGSTNGNNQNHHHIHNQHQQHHSLLMSSDRSSSTSLNNGANNAFVHLSGHENHSISTSCCESDETESTRSTVVSRLSIGSSMTSISAVMAVPGCCSNVMDANNNAVTLTQISECSQQSKQRKSNHSPNSSLSMNNNVIVGLDGLASSSPQLEETLGVGADEKGKMQYHHHPHHHLTDGDLHYHHQQQLGQQLHHHRSGGSVNNVTASPYSSTCSRSRDGLTSSAAEIPLEPPLSFQDRQAAEQVRRRQGGIIADDPDIANANAKMQQQRSSSSSNISPGNGSSTQRFRSREMGDNRNNANDMVMAVTTEQEISSSSSGSGNSPKDSTAYAALMQQCELQYAQLERVRSPFSHDHQHHVQPQPHHRHQQQQQRQDHIKSPALTTYGGSGSRKEPSRNNNNNSLRNENESNINSTATTTNNNQIVAVMDGNNNEEELFDDDELALLADELGLDQEDEDLFKAMLAEIEAADDDLEEYGPILLASSANSSVIKCEREQASLVSKPDHKQIIMKADDDHCKQEKSDCERNQREAVVSAKLGTAAFNHNNDKDEMANAGGALSTSKNNINRGNDNGNELATVRNPIRDGRNDNAAKMKRNGASSIGGGGDSIIVGNSTATTTESWTISNSYGNGDVRDLGRITISKEGTRSGGGILKTSAEPVKNGKEVVRIENPPLMMKQEIGGSFGVGGGAAAEFYRAGKTNDSSSAPNPTGSSDNKGLIDEGCNGNFESASDLQQQQQQRLQKHKSHHDQQHTQQQHLLHHRPQPGPGPGPARPLSYHKGACKQGNEHRNGTILLENEKVVEPIMDKRFAERSQIVLLTSQQETSVTSMRRDESQEDSHRRRNPNLFNNNLDDQQDDLTNTASKMIRATNQKIMSTACSIRDHTDDRNHHHYHDDDGDGNNDNGDNDNAGSNAPSCITATTNNKNISRIKNMLPQESSSKMTLFVAGLPVSMKEQGLTPNTQLEGQPPSPPRRAKGPEKRSSQEGKYETSHKLQGEILRSNLEVSKNSTEAGGAGEEAVGGIKGDEKWVASDVHSPARHNSLKLGLSVVSCDGGDGANSLAINAKGSYPNFEVINNKEATTVLTDGGNSAGTIIKCEDGKTNSRRIHVPSSHGILRGGSSSESTCPSAVSSSVTSSLVKNSSESVTALGGPTRENVDCNRQTGDDRRTIRSSNFAGSSCPQENECIPLTQESTVRSGDAGCRSTSSSEVVVVEVVAGGKQETYFKGKPSQPTTLLSSSSSLAGTGASTTSSSSPIQQEQRAESDSPQTRGTARREAGSAGPDTCSTSPGTMDSSTEVLHQYIPPTFSRLPPDGDEFPNSWSDEKQQAPLKKFDSRQLYRAELNLKEVEGAPPPLPTTGPPVEDLSSPVPEDLGSTKVHPVSMPHLPPKPLATRQTSIDDKRRLFESSSPVPIGSNNKAPLQNRNSSSSGASSMNSTNGTNSNSNSPPTMSRAAGLAAEPSKKSVRDKIAMFSNRTGSAEDAPDFTAAKPPSGAIITSSLRKSALVGNGTSLSRSSDNILQGLNMSASSMSGNENDGYRGINSLSKINRSSLDISSISNGGHGINSNGSSISRKSAADLVNFNSRPIPFYGSSGGVEPRSSTLGRGATTKYQYENGISNGNNDAFTSGKVLYERSQSMVDVGGPAASPIPNNNTFRNSYHTESATSINRNGTIATSRYSTSTMNTTSSPTMNGRLPPSPSSVNSNPASAAASSIMEQRRKCMTKLRGLVIPDVPPSDVVAQVATNNSLASIDLPTIISKDAPVIVPHVLGTTNKYSNNGFSKSFISRSESLDGISSSDDNSSLQFSSVSTVLSSPTTNSAKLRSGQFDSGSSDLPDWKLTTNALPKYSPAFKRRSLTAYQPSSPSKSSLLTSPQPYRAATQLQTKPAVPTPEPKSLESLTSPKSDSSFEFNRQRDPANLSSQPTPVKRNSFEKEAPQNGSGKVEENVQDKNTTTNNAVNGKGKYEKGGKLDDSDNDSAVSSSRSSISHGLSPPNSPTPGESSTTPDPDQGESSRDERVSNSEAGMGDSSMSDESWRILKPTSVEAINRKNVLTSAKFSSGGGTGGAQANVGDDSSVSSSNGKNRRSDDEEASYADAETEDTESSCSELEVSKSRRRMIVAGRVNTSQRRNCKADTEEEDYEELEEQLPAHLQPVTLHSEQHSLDLGDDLVLPGLTESPLQAIYDMEVKMAYINEVCDALPGSGRSDSASRYFSRRDSEATVIERPIEPKRKLSMDMLDSADRRARNRSSSGNESDFSSSISQKSTLSRSSRDRETKPETDRWSLLEKKYSKSMTAVNLVAGKNSEPIVLSATLTPAASVPKIVTGASEIVEKKIEKIIEKSSSTVDGPLKKITNANIPRGRNDFRSLAEKWQQISNDGKPTGGPPPVGPKPSLSRQNSTSSISSTATAIAVAPPSIAGASMKNRFEPENSDISTPSSPSRDVTMKEMPTPSTRTRPSISPKPTATSTPIKSSTVSNVLEAIEADTAWAETRRSDVTKANPRLVKSPNPEHVQMAPTKRSVSVNDIRKAFEKAESAMSPYGREDNNSSMKKDPTALTLPSVSAAHFRVSSFDSTTSEESSATTPAGMYGSVNSLVSSAPRDPYGSITSLASSTSLISPQELQQLIDEANQSLEEAGTPSHEVSVVILHREFVGGSLGITLAGGADYETKEITVHKVITGSIADRDARVHRGDRVLSINGKSTKGLTHREALNLLKAPRTEVVLVVSRGRTAANGFKTIDEASITLDRAVEPLLTGSLSSLLENDDDIIYKWGPLRSACLIKDGAGLGFSLEGGKGSINGDRPLTVKKIFIGGPAEKCGDMKVGDLIVSINGVNMSTKSRTEAWNFMKKLGDGEVKLAIRSAFA